jgi:PTH1 family peptidyl-tRNA hydrolase
VLIIVGLGNPGSEYAGTRHNIGFDIVDHTAAQLDARFRQGPGDYRTAEVTADGRGALLVKPMTYMNNSGAAVSDVLRSTGAAPGEIVVVSDDFHLPLGRLRLRLDGSAGGHNGLGSIIDELGTSAFPRLRCGIGGATLPTDKARLREYVLRPFDRDERSAVEGLIRQAHTFLTLIIAEGPALARQNFTQTI